MKYDLVEEIRNCPEMMAKIRADDRRYAQNLYAAWCNMQWCPKEFWPILRQDPDKDLWSASWRGSGGIVADLRNKGEDYMDYYCSGMRGGLSFDGKDDDAIAIATALEFKNPFGAIDAVYLRSQFGIEKKEETQDDVAQARAIIGNNK